MGETPQGETPHGTYNGYQNYRCRCAACCAANTAYYRDYRKRRALREGGSVLGQLMTLERIAEGRGWDEALGIIRMHMRVIRLDASLDALRRGEL